MGPNVDSDLQEETKVMSAIYDFGFSENILVIHLEENSQLRVESLTRFKDPNGRSNTQAIYMLKKVEDVQAVEEAEEALVEANEEVEEITEEAEALDNGEPPPGDNDKYQINLATRSLIPEETNIFSELAESLDASELD